MLTIDALIALILALAAPFFLAHLPSLQTELKSVRVNSRGFGRVLDRTVHRSRFQASCH